MRGSIKHASDERTFFRFQVHPEDSTIQSCFQPFCLLESSSRGQQQRLRAAVFFLPELRVRALSRRPGVPVRNPDMLARRRLLAEGVDAPEVNENICFLPDLLTSLLGHASWQVTRVRRLQRCPIFPPQPRNS